MKKKAQQENFNDQDSTVNRSKTDAEKSAQQDQGSIDSNSASPQDLEPGKSPVKTDTPSDEASLTQRDLGGFTFNKGTGRLVAPLSSVLYFSEDRSDGDLIVAVPAKTQTWMVAQSFVTSVRHLIPDFDDRVNSLTYDLNDEVLREARNRGNLSREVLANIVGYLAKFRDFIGMTALAREAEGKVDFSKQFADEDDQYLLVRSFAKFLSLGSNSGALLDVLSSAFSPAQVNAILAMAIDNVDRYLIRGVLSPAVMRFALEDQISASSDWVGLISTLTLPNSERAIRDLQDLYRYASLSRTLDALGNKIQDISSGSPSLATLIQIFNIFSSFDGPVVHLSIHDVIATSLVAAGFPKAQKTCPSGQLLVRELTALPDEFRVEVTRLQMMRFYVSLLYFYTKRTNTVREAWDGRVGVCSGTYGVLSLLTADSALRATPGEAGFVSSYSKFPYFEQHPHRDKVLRLEKDEESVFSALQRLFNRMFVREVFSLAVSGEQGTFKNRLLSLIDERSLERSDVWNTVLDADLSADSLYFEAWLRASKRIFHLAVDEDIYFPGDSSLSISFLQAAFAKILKEFDTAVLPNTHPSSILEGAVMTQVFIDYFSGSETISLIQDWTLSDKMLRKSSGRDMVYDPLSDTFSEFFSANLSGGTYLDIPSMFPRGVHLYHLDKELHVARLLVDPIKNSLISDSDIGQFLLSHPQFDALAETGFAEKFLRDGSITWEAYFSPDDVATRMNLPLPLAQRLWNEALHKAGASIRYVITYTGPKTRFLSLPTEMHPFQLFERDSAIGATTILVPYPYQASRSFKGCLDALPDLTVTSVVDGKGFSRTPTESKLEVRKEPEVNLEDEA